LAFRDPNAGLRRSRIVRRWGSAVTEPKSELAVQTDRITLDEVDEEAAPGACEDADRAAHLPPRPTMTLPEMPAIQVEIRHAGPERRKPPSRTPTENPAVRTEPLNLPSDFPSAGISRDSGLFSEGEFVTDISRLTDPGGVIDAEVRRDRVILLRMDSAEAGEVFSLGQGETRAGRTPQAELAVRDDSVSRVHAKIYLEGSLCLVEDQGSTNGTFVQGRRVQKAVLHDGDTVQFGPRVRFRYSTVDARQESVLRSLYQSSKVDALTGACNRKHFEERLEVELGSAQRRHATLSLLMVDLDHFKLVNDRYGHPAGDAVLQHVSSLVKQRLRSGDLLARVGGEEFAVILPGADLRTAGRIGERVRVSIATKPVFFADQHIPVSISVGCASLTCCQATSVAELVAIADRRLYAAKHGGRNRVVWSE
jgi:two-component system cell cycle response regulator